MKTLVSSNFVRFRHKRLLRPRNIWQISIGTEKSVGLDRWRGRFTSRDSFLRLVFYLIADSARVNDSSSSSTFSLTNSWSYHASRQYRVQLIHLLYYTSLLLFFFSFFWTSIFPPARKADLSRDLEILESRIIRSLRRLWLHPLDGNLLRDKPWMYGKIYRNNKT